MYQDDSPSESEVQTEPSTIPPTGSKDPQLPTNGISQSEIDKETQNAILTALVQDSYINVDALVDEESEQPPQIQQQKPNQIGISPCQVCKEKLSKYRCPSCEVTLFL